MSRLIGEQKMMDDGDIWHEHWEDEESDKALAEKIKREGVPLPANIMKYAVDGTYHRFYEPSPDGAWFDENGRTIKNPDDYKVSTARGTKGMPVPKRRG